MFIKIFKKIFVSIFLFSVLIHAIVVFEDVIVPRVADTPFCKNENLFLSLLDGCSPINSYLRPYFYFGLLDCKITGGTYERSSSGTYSCLARPVPRLIDHKETGYIILSKEGNFETMAKKAKSICSSFLINYYTVSIFPLSAVIFITWMFANCMARPIPKKGAWIALILFGYIYGALIYYFVVKKKATKPFVR